MTTVTFTFNESNVLPPTLDSAATTGVLREQWTQPGCPLEGSVQTDNGPVAWKIETNVISDAKARK